MKPTNRYSSLSRRDFLKLAGAGLGTLALRPFERVFPLPQFPSSERLGRICIDGKVDVKAAPNEGAATVNTVYSDTVVEWLREVVGPKPYYINQRWVETPGGYIYTPYLQPVRNMPNTPLTAMPEGKNGFWAEVTVPYVDLYIENPPPRSPWAKDIIEVYRQYPRLYYTQVAWIDQIKTNEAGQVLYRFNEDPGHGYGYGDIFWAEGAAFRPLTAEEIAPISPDVDPNDKKVVINLTYQTLSCYEGNTEVFFCKISSGAKWDAYGNAVDTWSTPVGPGHSTHWKAISVHMSGGTTGAGYDTPAISWSTFFSGDGIAIHAAFWHNDFGSPRSHGCVNARPEDAKWIFCWTTPHVSLEQSELRMTWPDHGTLVDVVERKF
ncbi:MAG: L,D-transpeptidase [Chloroflexi bacterium]|nr:L,D-transpeptidase [Chloroflexota bacterium]